MTSTDALIHALSTDCLPVKRRSVWREAAALIVLGVAELVLLVSVLGTRPDMGQVFLSRTFLWKICSLALLAGFTATVAIRSFSPQTTSRRALMPALGLAGLVTIAGAFVASAAERGRPLIDRIDPTHGLLCSASIIVLALPMVMLLGVLMRRAAPVHPDRSAMATGLAAATFGALVFTARCPMSDPLYIVVWYSAGVAVVTAASRWLLPRRFRL